MRDRFTLVVLFLLWFMALLGAGSILPITEDTNVSLGVVFSIFAGAWWMKARFDKIDRRLEKGDQKFDELPCAKGSCKGKEREEEKQ